ncbi:amine oxidase [Paraburkholderia bannensis]|nr:FAD-dependent oxidoreductase [Paraburkholderia bannensis]RQM44590.1 amine oxidase [Paraburkholderia bannensis]
MTAAEAPPLDIAIIGAGLCGLALARALHARGRSFVLVEASTRLGGRVLTRRCDVTGQRLDLGPTWFWPDTEPRMAALISELGIESVPQHDPGDALWLTDPNRGPERRSEPGGIHAGARRIAGGTARLLDKLCAALPLDSIRLGHALRLVRDRGAWFDLQLAHGELTSTLRARQVVLALPPRLVAEHVAFDPPLPAELARMLAATPTWMASAAKSLTTYAQPFWRTAGHSGNAWVRHVQATLAEVFDASDPETEAGALGGFVALDAVQRKHFARGLPLLIESQLVQLYGPGAEGGRQYRHDWADEVWICSRADRDSPPAWPQPDAALRGAWFGDRLYFGGSETALHGAGRMEGALDSAARIARALAPPDGSADFPGGTLRAPATVAEAIACFANAVSESREAAPAYYRRHVVRLLSGPYPGPFTQHALLATVSQVYSEALAVPDRLMPTLGTRDADAAQIGRHRFTPALLEPFQGWSSKLLESALAFNATSCALSNFPDDHHPDAELQRAVVLALADAWREFALELNERLVDAAERDRAAGAAA